MNYLKRPARLSFLPTSTVAWLSMFVAGIFCSSAVRAQIALDQQPVAWVSPIEFSNYKLSSGSAVAFRADYVRGSWDGDLVAYNVSNTGTWSPKWSAQQQLPAHGSRKIFTSLASGNGAAFRWASLSPTQQAALGDATNGPKVLDYLRGDPSNAATATNPAALFRGRFSRLGGVVHGRPYFKGAEVYVGGNDGMLHAFDAATGVEKFAYVPSMLFANGKLKALSSKDSIGMNYTVDAPLAIGKVGAATWLFAGLGAGAKGLFALDISNPSPSSESGAAAMAKWEITPASTGYANLGHVMSAVKVVKLNGGETALLVPNGLNSTNKVSSLFVIRASDGVLLKEISAGAVSTIDNGLGAIAAVDRDGNGTVDLVYAGDLQGMLWKFDLSSTTLPNSGTVIFTPDASTTRPITAAPSVSAHPQGGMLVNFGTGRVYTDADLTSTESDYLYGIWDKGAVTSSSLVVQTLTTHSVVTPAVIARTASSNAVNYDGANKGWRITLGPGERLVGGDTLTDGGRYTVTTTVPNAGSGQGAWLVEVSALNGGAPAKPFFDLNGNGVIDDADRVTSNTGASEQLLVPVAKFLGSGVWSQPVLAQFGDTLDLPYLNYNPNVALPTYTVQITAVPPTPVGSGGVYGGHFDFDIFYNCDPKETITKANCAGQEHVHEYDDKFNVVGVNMLNPSDPGFMLSRALPSTTSPGFKILLANTRWSPAATMVIGDTISGEAWKIPVSPEGFVAETPGGPAKVFANRAALNKFIFVLPLSALGGRDWGTGQVRAGLIPTTTGCVQDNANPSGAWMDGAFTIQVVAASANGGDVQPNTSSLYQASDPPGGFRLRDTNGARNKLIAQYTAFWHEGLCRTQGGWSMAPPIDPSSAGTGSSPAGTDDPKGNFAAGVTGGPGSADGGTVTKYFYNGVEVLVVLQSSITGVRQVITTLSGTVLSDATSSFGELKIANLQKSDPARLGRLGWKEIIR